MYAHIHIAKYINSTYFFCTILVVCRFSGLTLPCCITSWCALPWKLSLILCVGAPWALPLPFFYSIILYRFFGNFTSCTLIPLTSHFLHICPHPCSVMATKDLPFPKLITNKTKAPLPFLPLQHLFFHSSDIIGSCSVSYGIPFCPSAPPVNAHCN